MKTATTQGILISFGRRVRQLRKARGWSQEVFAQQCGLDRSYVGGVERGDRNIGLMNIGKMAEALGVDEGRLFEDGRQTEQRPVRAVAMERRSGTHE